MISICCTVRNRTIVHSQHGDLHLFRDCVESLKSACKDIEWELVITDWKSTDTDYKWLPENHKLITIDKDGFSRGYGLNLAAENASHNNLYFTDTDMLINSGFIQRCIDTCNRKQAYFPVCWSVAEKDRHRSQSYVGSGSLPNKRWNGRVGATGWRTTGRGMCAMNKQIWEKAGKWPEYWKWGREDGDFCRNIMKHYKVIRNNDNGLVHCWHPAMRT